MLTVEMEKVLSERKITNNQKQYFESLKKFNDLVRKGVLKKRENQLLVDTSNLQCNNK